MDFVRRRPVRMSKTPLVGGLAVLALAIMACPVLAGTMRDDRNPQLYLSLGANPAYASVGSLLVKEGGTTFAASGVLINTSWVLTAAHCVDGATALTFSLNGQNYTGTRWLADPSWNGDPLHGYDIGLIQLATPATTVKPATRYTSTRELGQVATIVGYGKSGTGWTGGTTNDGKKRGGQNTVDATAVGPAKNGTVLLADFDSPWWTTVSTMGSNKPLNLESLIGPGDSGCGLFLDAAGGPQLAGIASYVQATDGKADGSYGDIAGFTRVSSFNSWIDSAMASLSTTAKTATKTAAKSPLAMSLELGPEAAPEPATLALLATGLGGLVLRMRRRAR
jgi:hypothetical protein